MPPPPIPPSKPPPVPGQHRKVATIVYGVFSLLFILAVVLLAYERGVLSGRGNPGYAFGMVQGSVVLPLALAVGIACCWKRNRNIHTLVRVLFWASAFLVFIKINQLVNHGS